ncbi:MAG: ABC transporter permease [Flavobacteriales bacterium]|nr:ABC transporter permease [Flavobacteriales bacterium]
MGKGPKLTIDPLRSQNRMSSHRVIIGPGSVSQNYWRDLWQYRGLLLFLAWRDVMVRYKQTAIGILWAVLRPVLTILAMWFIGWLFGSTVPAGTPRLLMVCAATLPWQFFATSFSETSNSLISNSNLLTKVYFPRLILPFSTVLVSAIDFAVAFLILVIMMVWYAYLPGPEVFLLPLFVLLTLVVSFGAGLLIASLNVKYRDFRYVVPFIVQFGLYVTPVAFSSQDIFNNPGIPAVMKYLYACNPMVAVIDGFRYCLFGAAQTIHWPGFITSCCISLLLLFIGIRHFRRTERGFADII